MRKEGLFFDVVACDFVACFGDLGDGGVRTWGSYLLESKAGRCGFEDLGFRT